MCHYKFTLAVIGLSLLIATGVFAQAQENVEQVGRIYNFWSYAHNHQIQDTLAYISAGVAGLQILNITDPEDIQLEAYYDNNPGQSYAIKVFDSLAYLLDWNFGLQILDISNLDDIHVIGTFPIRNYVTDFDVNGDYAYIAHRSSPLYIIDISNSENPEEISTIEIPSFTQDVIAAGDYIFLTGDRNTGLMIIDVSDPETPETVFSTYDPRTGYSIDISGDYLYLGGYGADEFHIFDITDRESPEIIVEIDLERTVYGVKVQEGIAYICANGLQIINVSNPENLRMLSFFQDDGLYPYSIELLGNYAYLTSTSSFHSINISDPLEPELGCAYLAEGRLWGTDVADEHLYVADMSYGLRIIDISDPGNPEEISNFPVEGSVRDVAVSINHAYLTVEDVGLHIIDISDPANPQQVDFLNSQEGAKWITTMGNHAFMTASGFGLRIADISEPENAVWIGHCATPGNALRIAMTEENPDLAFIADMYEGLCIVDVSNPRQPEVISSMDESNIVGVGVSNEYAFINNFDNVFVVDISNVGEPEIIQTYETVPDGNASSIEIAGDYLYLAHHEDGLRVIDISNPEAIEEIGYYNTPGTALNSVYSNGFIYVSDNTNIGVYRFLGIPRIEISAEEIDFGQVLQDTSVSIPLVIRNSSIANLNINNVYIEGDNFHADFREAFIIEPDSSYILSVSFIADTTGEYNGELIIISNDPSQDTLRVCLRGECISTDYTNKERESMPLGFSLFSPFPNPFNSTTTISYSLPAASQVSLKVFDLSGREVKSLVEGYVEAGNHTVSLSGEGMASGVYYINLERKGETVHHKALLLK